MNNAFRNILGLFAPAREIRVRDDLSGMDSTELVSDVDYADRELQKRHDEMAGRIRGLAEILEHLNSKGPLSNWLEQTLSATFNHHRRIARENVAFQHSIAHLRRCADDNAARAGELERQLDYAVERLSQQDASIRELEGRLSKLSGYSNYENRFDELLCQLENSEETALQWYTYAQELEAEIFEARRNAHDTSVEIAMIQAELDAERQDNRQQQGRVQARVTSLQQLLTQSQESAVQNRLDLHQERYKAEQLALEVSRLQEQGRALRKNIQEAEEVNKCLDLARLTLVQKLKVQSY